MRYLIDHVLEGIKADRKTRLTDAQAKYDQLGAELTKLQADKACGPEDIAAHLRRLAQQVHSGTVSTYSDADRIVRDAFNSVPSAMTIGNKRKQFEQAGRELDTLRHYARTCRSDLEVFLSGIKEGGETHVSQHGLKQAGYGHVTIAPLIVARSRG